MLDKVYYLDKIVGVLANDLVITSKVRLCV